MHSVAQSPTPCTAHKRRVNGLIHQGLHEHLDPEPVAFFCECNSPRCFETVWLTAGEYEAARLDAGWLLLARGHG